MRSTRIILLAPFLMLTLAAFGSVFGSVRGIVHDAQHRPVENAIVTLRSTTSDWATTSNTDSSGQFIFNAVALGEYTLTVVAPSFNQATANLRVNSGSQPVLHFSLSVATNKETVQVSGAPEAIPTDSATTTTLVGRLDIEHTPGAARSNSMAMITDYVPGAYITHDQLHIRGGHQTSWLIDGVPVPNTNIASNLGPQFDPKDIDYLEVDRGSYGAEFGDRTYGVFNVVPRTGFERNSQAELVLSAGNFYQTNDALSFGSHTERFAYYASVNANRSNLGLQPPVAQVVHDADNGVGGFGSLIFNVNPSNQLRLIASARRDYFQIPYDPFPNDFENSDPNGYPSIGLRDSQREKDAGLLFSWVHTFNSHLMTTVSPFYHYNRGDYASSPNDDPVGSIEDRSSIFVGGQGTFAANYKHNDLQAGFVSFYQSDYQLFGATLNPPQQPQCVTPTDPTGTCTPFTDSERPTATLETLYD